MGEANKVLVLKGENIAAYGFGDGHPFGPDRHDAFHQELARHALDIRLAAASDATREELECFHTPRYIDFVAEACAANTGFLDGGDTPAQAGMAKAATAVAGATLHAVNAVMQGQAPRAFVPIVYAFRVSPRPASVSSTTKRSRSRRRSDRANSSLSSRSSRWARTAVTASGVRDVPPCMSTICCVTCAYFARGSWGRNMIPDGGTSPQAGP